MPEMLSLPRLERQQMELDNLISSRCRSYVLQLPEHAVQFRLHRQEEISPYIGISFYAEGRPGHVYLGIQAVAALLGEEQDPSIYPAPLLAALLASQLSGIIQNLSSLLRTELEIDVISTGMSLPDGGTRFGLQVSSGATTGFGLIAIPAHVVKHVADLLASQPAEASPLPDQLPIKAQLLLAERRLSVGDLNRLEAGDVFLLPPGTPTDHVILRIPGYGACRAHLDAQTLVVVTPMTSDMHDLTETLEEPSDLENLELTLEFHLGSLNLTLNELSQLAEGTTFDLGVTLEAPVSAKVNGQTLARCELVDIEGRLGARVVRLTGANSEVTSDD